MHKKNKKNPHHKQLSYSEKALAQLKGKYPNYSLISNLIMGFFLLGLVLTIWEINIYRETFISVYILLSIYIFSGLIITAFFKKTFNIYCLNEYNPGHTHLFFHYLFNTISFGGVLIFLFMWTNQNFSNKSKQIITLPINSVGRLAKTRRSCGNPYAKITYSEIEKELIFSCSTEIEKYSKIYLEIEKGFWGFYVITNKILIE